MDVNFTSVALGGLDPGSGTQANPCAFHDLATAASALHVKRS